MQVFRSRAPSTVIVNATSLWGDDSDGAGRHCARTAEITRVAGELARVLVRVPGRRCGLPISFLSLDEEFSFQRQSPRCAIAA